jgi:glycosyltransferase involved in cell wall biosynthesis
MRAALDLRVLEDPALGERGIGRYARELAAALRARVGEAGASPPARPGHASERAQVELVELRGLARPPAPARIAELWEHALLGRDARRAGADVLHSPAIDLTTIRPGMPYVVTLHDLVPLKRPERYLRTGLKHRLRYAAVRRATRVIVPTRAVADDAVRLLGPELAERIDVVPEAPAPVFRPLPSPRDLLARLDLPPRFLVWAGGLDPPDPRKRIEALAAHVAAGDGLPLVLAGRCDAAGAQLAADGRVLLAGRVSDEELAALYGAAEALVLPSEDEGFGLTPHEALACGTPVAAFAVPALREALEGRRGVTLVEPGDVGALVAAAEALAGAAVDPPARTWDDVARDTLAAYERAGAPG